MTPPLAIPRLVAPPPGSRITAQLPGADFADAWAVPAGEPGLSALGQFLKAARATPPWVEACMRLRNRVVRWFGLKDLGGLSDLDPQRPLQDYRPGDRVGIFTLLENHPDEVLLGDRDRHLEVVLSVHTTGALPASQVGPAVVTITTVVHVHNWLGRLYMLPVAPMHRRIAPAVLRAVG